MVTHEVKITRESRYGPGSSRPRLRGSDGEDDDDVELRQQNWESTDGSSVSRLPEVHSTEQYDKSDHYRDSFTKQQVVPLGNDPTLGRVTSVRIRCESRADKEVEIKL